MCCWMHISCITAAGFDGLACQLDYLSSLRSLVDEGFENASPRGKIMVKNITLRSVNERSAIYNHSFLHTGVLPPPITRLSMSRTSGFISKSRTPIANQCRMMKMPMPMHKRTSALSCFLHTSVILSHQFCFSAFS
jgi:hypothetical protein